MWIYIIIFLPIILYLIKKFSNGRFTNLRKDMSGKVIVITGSSAGLGKETAFQLLNDGADVVFACRDEKKTLQVINSCPNKQKAHFMKLDLSSFASVYNFSVKIKIKFKKIDLLMNNAGVFPTIFNITNDNIESVFQTNVLSHVLLTFLLLDHFNEKEGKIINLASHFHIFSNYNSKTIEVLEKNSFMIYEHLYYRNVMSKNTLYGNTKIGNIFFTQTLAEILENKFPHIKTVSLHPGAVFTDFTASSMSSNFIFRALFYIISPFIYLFFRSPKAGAQTQLHLTYMENKEMINGAYYENCRENEKNRSKVANDRELRKAFINYCLNMLRYNLDPKIFKKIEYLI